MAEWLIRLPDGAVEKFDASTAKFVDELITTLDEQGFAVENVELKNAVYRPVELVRGRAIEAVEPDGPDGINEVESKMGEMREEWPHVLVICEDDPTDAVLAFDWSSPTSSGTEMDKLLEFVHQLNDGKVSLEDTQSALSTLITCYLTDQGRSVPAQRKR